MVTRPRRRQDERFDRAGVLNDSREHVDSSLSNPSVPLFRVQVENTRLGCIQWAEIT